MDTPKSVSFSGKAGDVTSIDDVSERAAAAIRKPPAEAILTQQAAASDHSGTPVRHELKILAKRVWGAKSGKAIALFFGALVAVVILNVIGEWRLNKWQGAFFRAIEHKNLNEVGHQALLFLGIVVVLLVFVVTQNWILEQVKIRLRERLTHSLLDDWMKPGHAYRLNMTSEDRLNPDHRIQEDVKNFSQMTGDLAMGVLRSFLMLVCFIGVLWNLSKGILLPLGERMIEIPGYMVWFAILYAMLGSWLAAWVGAPLIRLNEERYTREANFRYSLVRISDNAESISLYKGERDERQTVNQNFTHLVGMLKILAFANARLTWIASGHGWLVVILPVLVALPGYMQGKLDFGGLMMVVGAFNQVQTSLRWFVENFARIADWRSSLHRVSTFTDAVTNVDNLENQPEKIELVPSESGNLIFDKTQVALVDGQVVISDATAEILPGERVLLVGESGSGKSTLLRAVGGLWPWGSGRIQLPPEKDMMFLPQRPYIPLGTLSQALSYPHWEREHSPEVMERALRRVNLEEFIPLLGKAERWDKVMSLGQQQRLAFARLLIHTPKWIFLDESTSALDGENQHLVMSMFLDELKDSAVISIAHREGLEAYHTRTLHLVETHSGRVLKRQARAHHRKRGALLARIKSKLKSSAREREVEA